MKRKILAIGLGMSLLLSTPIMADVPDIDLTSMSTEDLISLKNSIDSEIGTRGGDNIIGQGTYEVGVDIKAANFKLTSVQNADYTSTYIYIYNSKEDMEADKESDDYIIYYDAEESGTVRSANLNLKDGQFVKISGDSAVIEEAKASWQP